MLTPWGHLLWVFPFSSPRSGRVQPTACDLSKAGSSIHSSACCCLSHTIKETEHNASSSVSGCATQSSANPMLCVTHGDTVPQWQAKPTSISTLSAIPRQAQVGMFCLQFSLTPKNVEHTPWQPLGTSTNPSQTTSWGGKGRGCKWPKTICFEAHLNDQGRWCPCCWVHLL